MSNPLALTASTSTASPERFRSIDLLRGLAVALMIATHTANAFLADEFKQNDIWYGVNIIFGFVAPTFLFCSGVTFRIALERRQAESSAHASGKRSLTRRALMLLLLGYWLQIPVLSLRQLVWEQRPEELARLFDANILQVIALCMIALILLKRATRSDHRARIIALATALGITLATPYIWQADLQRLIPPPFGPYLAPQPPASFSLFPNAAYVLFGFALSPTLLASERNRFGWMKILGSGLALLGAGLALDAAIGGISPHNDFWGSSAQHVLFRLGGILTAATPCVAAAEVGLRLQPAEYVGARSLSIYTLHLMLIYGSPMNMGMRYWMDGAFTSTLSPWAVFAVTIAILLLCAQAARAWDHLRNRRPTTALRLKQAWWGVFWGFFLLTP